MRKRKNIVITAVILIFINGALCFAGRNLVRNGSFRTAKGRGLTQKTVESFRGKGLKVKDFEKALKTFEAKKSKLSDKELRSSLQKRIARLKPYVTTEEISTVKLSNYNDMILLTRVLQQIFATGGR